MMPDQNGIYITKKQASIASAVLVFLSIIIFIAGYFWGKQSALEDFTQKTSKDSFNDQVDYLLTMQSFAAKHGALPDEAEEKEENIPDALEETETLGKVENKEQLVLDKKEIKQSSKDEIDFSNKNLIDSKNQKDLKNQVDSLAKNSPEIKNDQELGTYYAALAGFGKKSSALSMIQRLKKYKIDLDLKTKISKSVSGKGTRTWYQVVTKKYATRDELDQVIDKIISLEHIKRKDIKIF